MTSGRAASFSIKRACAPALLALIFVIIPTSAQQARKQYRTDFWTTDEGLPQNSVRSILQTRDGYLWFTTNDGLVRFDGVRFRIFGKGNTPGIVSNRFTSLHEDAQGDLWAGTEDGGLTRYSMGRFQSNHCRRAAEQSRNGGFRTTCERTPRQHSRRTSALATDQLRQIVPFNLTALRQWGRHLSDTGRSGCLIRIAQCASWATNVRASSRDAI